MSAKIWKITSSNSHDSCVLVKFDTRTKITFALEVKTVNYALGSSNAFVLFLVDVNEEKTYFLPLQDYFIANPDKIDTAENNGTSVTVHLDPDKNLIDVGEDLIELAKSVYAGGPSRNLHKVV